MKDKLWIGALTVVVIIAVAGYLFSSGYFSSPSEEVPSTGEVKKFAMTAEKWEFNLTRIEVKVGDTVILKITGLDDGIGSGHGFAISGFDINEVIRKDQTVTIEFVADKTGTFTFFCSVYCGVGHSNMRGTLVVS